LQKFTKRFSDSPLTLNAQARIDVLKKAVQERENQARAAREAEAAERRGTGGGPHESHGEYCTSAMKVSGSDRRVVRTTQMTLIGHPQSFSEP
jgi:hypothetical protein